MAVFYRKWSDKDWELKQERECSIKVLSICYILDIMLGILKFSISWENAHGNVRMIE